MIEGLKEVLEGTDLPGLGELRDLLGEILGGWCRTGRLLEQQSLQSRPRRVFRLRFETDGGTRSVVVKRLRPEIGRREALAATRWLPAAGLQRIGPPLLGVAAARTGACVWHVYEDLGPCELDPRQPDRVLVESAIDAIATMHLRFAQHPLLGEVRLHGAGLGIHFYETNVRDALYALRAWTPRRAEHEALRGRLLDRLRGLRDDLPRRARALARGGGPETLLHGDLWAINVFVIPGPEGPRTRLIDWDHAAVGPATYDLSTFLLRFPRQHRRWMLDRYARAVGGTGWRLPAEGDLNLVFETHEYARFANRIIWPAIAMVTDRAAWGAESLLEVESWFDALEPALTPEESSRRRRPPGERDGDMSLARRRPA